MEQIRFRDSPTLVLFRPRLATSQS